MHVFSLPAGCLVKENKFPIDFINFQVLINNFTFNPKVREYFQYRRCIFLSDQNSPALTLDPRESWISQFCNDILLHHTYILFFQILDLSASCSGIGMSLDRIWDLDCNTCETYPVINNLVKIHSFKKIQRPPFLQKVLIYMHLYTVINAQQWIQNTLGMNLHVQPLFICLKIKLYQLTNKR